MLRCGPLALNARRAAAVGRFGGGGAADPCRSHSCPPHLNLSCHTSYHAPLQPAAHLVARADLHVLVCCLSHSLLHIVWPQVCQALLWAVDRWWRATNRTILETAGHGRGIHPKKIGICRPRAGRQSCVPGTALESQAGGATVYSRHCPVGQHKRVNSMFLQL